MTVGIVHRPIASAPPGHGRASAVSWRTCLREVTFFDLDAPGAALDCGEAERSHQAERAAEPGYGAAPHGGPGHGAEPHGGKDALPLTGAEAYVFLLETICGLNSPMLGETQVLGQFRAFLASLPPADASWLGPLGRQLMTDARTIRERHLRGLGSRSYGSAVRRHLDGAETVALVGAGSLATELLPYLSDGRRVDQWTRQDIARAGSRGAAPVSAVLVIAAPIRNEAVRRIAGCYARVARVIDLRSAEEPEPFDPALAVVTLDDVFASVEASAADTLARVERARRDIRGMAAALNERPQVRPFGWDDLCA